MAEGRIQKSTIAGENTWFTRRVRNLQYIIFGWDDLTVDLPFIQFMGTSLGYKLAWE
jgi:hypothetical protein